jgi:hypothetical protein
MTGETHACVQSGTTSTKNPPGAVARANCSVALSTSSTKGSLFSLTSYPWEMDKIMAPAVLQMAYQDPGK